MYQVAEGQNDRSEETLAGISFPTVHCKWGLTVFQGRSNSCKDFSTVSSVLSTVLGSSFRYNPEKVSSQPNSFVCTIEVYPE